MYSRALWYPVTGATPSSCWRACRLVRFQTSTSSAMTSDWMRPPAAVCAALLPAAESTAPREAPSPAASSREVSSRPACAPSSADGSARLRDVSDVVEVAPPRPPSRW